RTLFSWCVPSCSTTDWSVWLEGTGENEPSTTTDYGYPPDRGGGRQRGWSAPNSSTCIMYLHYGWAAGRSARWSSSTRFRRAGQSVGAESYSRGGALLHQFCRSRSFSSSSKAGNQACIWCEHVSRFDPSSAMRHNASHADR